MILILGCDVVFVDQKNFISVFQQVHVLGNNKIIITVLIKRITLPLHLYALERKSVRREKF